MWRALFLALGIYVFILGVEALAVERVVLKATEEVPVAANTLLASGEKKQVAKVLTPPPWAPWSLMATGAVTILYSFTLPRLVSGG